MAKPEMSQQCGEYMSLLANEGFPSSSNPDFGAGTSNPDFETDAASELDEVDYPIPPEDGPNDVYINIMIEIFAQGEMQPSYGIKHVIQTVKDHTGYDIPYQKAWYSLKMARDIIFGTWESSVRKLPKYIGALKKYNLGTNVEWEHKTFQPSTGAHVKEYVFWAFAPCIEGF
ncbi:UNVERIFIED_CONTAM: hypothetical protein Sradi_2867200 [Sesamum radiatum]|uniref:Uncharacterized protein n=1 Tax=Sesamum radiatum TaxID=300843 RepID=A0AAW2RXB9_SESRA